MKKLTALLPLSISIATALATAAHAQATGLQWSLPPEEQVVKALDGHPTVEAAGKRVGAASAASDMLRVGPHEVQLTGSYITRDVRLERSVDPFACPGRLPWIARQASLVSKSRKTGWKIRAIRRPCICRSSGTTG